MGNGNKREFLKLVIEITVAFTPSIVGGILCGVAFHFLLTPLGSFIIPSAHVTSAPYIVTLRPFSTLTSTPSISVTKTPTSMRQETPTPDIGELLSSAIDALPEGRRVFNPPDRMKLGKSERIEYRVVSIENLSSFQQETIEKSLESNLEGRGEPKVEEITIGTLMRTELFGDAFEIIPLHEEEQFISNDTFTEWAWDVTPLKTGTQRLTLRVSVIVIVDELGEKSRDFPTETTLIEVEINPTFSIRTFIVANWPLLCGGGGILFALLAYQFNLIKLIVDTALKLLERNRK